MSSRFSRPRLISADDRMYRAFLAQIMLSKANQRPTRAPYARELFGNEAEIALRTWLGQHVRLSDQRILEYFEQRGRTATKKYRELDAIELGDNRQAHIFEIKASRNAVAIRRAMDQIHETRAILAPLLAPVGATILLVDTGIPTPAEVVALMREADPPPVPPLTLADVLAMMPQIRLIDTLIQRGHDPELINLLQFSVDDIIAITGAEQLHLNWDEASEDLAVTESPAGPVYSTDSDDDESMLGTALRAALGRRKNRPE